MTYQYPLNSDWTTAEIVQVVQFLSLVEAAYEDGVNGDQLKLAYEGFKQVVSSIGEEKQIGRAFEAASGYSIYQVVSVLKAQMKQTANLKQVRIHL